jgi:hypothetical protein
MIVLWFDYFKDNKSINQIIPQLFETLKSPRKRWQNFREGNPPQKA